MRAGFVYKTEDDLITNNYQLERGLDAYTVPFTFVDRGVDGVLDTADDRNVQRSFRHPAPLPGDRRRRTSRRPNTSPTSISSAATRRSRSR